MEHLRIREQVDRGPCEYEVLFPRMIRCLMIVSIQYIMLLFCRGFNLGENGVLPIRG